MIQTLKARLVAIYTMLFLASCMAISQPALAELLPVPTLKARVTDLTQTLTPTERDALDAKLAAFEENKGSQIALLILPTTQPEDIAQYAIRVVDVWKIGRGKSDDGVLLLIAKDDRKIRIEVGYGLEGAIPDVYAKRIIADVISPKFKRGDFYGGLDAGINQLISLVDAETLPTPENQSSNDIEISEILPVLLFGGLISGLFLRIFFGSFLGSVFNGGLIGGIITLLGLAPSTALVFGIIAFFFTMTIKNITILDSYTSGTGGGNDGGGFSGSSGGWSGGGGGFGGGGASGDW